MQEQINLTIKTKYGEGLYVYPYSISRNNLQVHYYLSPEFTVYSTETYLEELSSWKANLFILYNSFKYWLEDYLIDLNEVFLGDKFDDYFSSYQCKLDLNYLKILLSLGYVFQASSVFGKNICLNGQLYVVSECKYIDDVYLTPTAEYFDERLEEWINEDVVSIYVKDTYITEEDKQELIDFYNKRRQDYKNWRDTEIAKGNRICYLYSLDT